jgi:hypothetical protein
MALLPRISNIHGMKITQKTYSPSTGWNIIRAATLKPEEFNLVCVFGCSALLEDAGLFRQIRDEFPEANILLNSTAGEIMDTAVQHDTLALTAIAFERTAVKSASITINTGESSRTAGQRLVSQIDVEGLCNLFVISDGQHVNGSELVLGIQETLPKNVIITGGLAGDGVNFRRTLVGLNQVPAEGSIAAIAFYGSALRISYGSVGGWDSFGPERLITRANGNILYELDGKPALEIYKKYLGEYAHQLPSAGLLFPLSIRTGNSDPLVRTILAVNENDQSLTFAGNMPEGYYARLMKAGFERLIEGAAQAARDTLRSLDTSPDLAILISCVGRKLVLDQRIEEEVEVIRNAYGSSTGLTGFYSYGEISPSYNSEGPELHNQTMTITTFTELQ